MTIAVKEWKIKQIKAENLNKKLMSYIGEVERETEKAYLVKFEACLLNGDDTSVTAWVPKSATMSVAEAQTMISEEKAEKESRYDALISFAKQNGIKGVRKGLKAVTILAKIQQAGLSYNY